MTPHHAASKPSILLLLLAVGGLVGAAPALAVVAGEHVVTAGPPDPNACSTPVPKTTFAPDDARAYLWLELLDTDVGDTVEWRWFAPGGAAYATSRYTTTFAGDGCAWAWIDIAGQPAATRYGDWRVDVHLNDALAATATFAITDPGTSVPSGGGAAHLELSANDHALVPWGYLRLAYRIASFDPGLRVDLYVAMLLDGGGAQCVAPELVFTGVPAHATDLALANGEAVITAGWLPARLTPLTMTLYGVLVARGASPADSANWVSNLAALDVSMGPLSSDQMEVIAARGNPQSWVIQFFPATEQRVETWLYDGGGLGRAFRFINGRPLPDDEAGSRASASAVTEATFYDPGRFDPATTPAEVRALLGDPDRVVAGAPGTEVWIFNGSHIAVTVQRGVVRQIEAY